jgi:hypothetical protein
MPTEWYEITSDTTNGFLKGGMSVTNPKREADLISSLNEKGA